ncbi:MAG: hypothetical protein ACI8TQ_000422 [Planctomycetota bacterium]|jgi:hypothetical protein
MLTGFSFAATDPESSTSEPIEPVRYGRDVRGILSSRCFQCHGADVGTREAGLRLDQRESATAGAYPAIVPGDAEASELWRRIRHEDPDEAMPPARAKKRPFSSNELEVLRHWIDSGAEYEPHWAFEAPIRPPPPSVTNESWPRNEIDRFVLAGLESKAVTPAPEADSATLLRRVFLDLTGLAPTVEELEVYLSDNSFDAYERAVDRIFTEDIYRSRLSERLATSWMDAARFGDTSGIHTDNGRQMWPWRDWVLDAFRDNLPYDRFVTEQLAGDLLPDATNAQKIASGFNRNNVTTDEGGALSDEYLVEYAIDRTSTTSTVFMGLTMGCARCHDHKYDPITQRDFYQMVGFFNSIDEPGVYSQTADANRAYEPFIEIPTSAQTARLDSATERRDELTELMAQGLPQEDERLAIYARKTRADAGADWTVPTVLSASSSSPEVILEVRADGSVAAVGEMPNFEDYSFVLENGPGFVRAIHLEALTVPNPDPDAEIPDGAGRASHGNAVVSKVTLETRAGAPEGDWLPVPVNWAWSDYSQRNADFEALNVITGKGQGWAAGGNADAGAHALVLLVEDAFGHADGSQLRVTVSFRSPYGQHSLGRVRFRTSDLSTTRDLPVGFGRWYRLGPFASGVEKQTTSESKAPFDPEIDIDPDMEFGVDGRRWIFDGGLVDGEPSSLGDDAGVSYLARTLQSPDARTIPVQIEDALGCTLFVNGKLVEASQETLQAGLDVELRSGANTFVLRIVHPTKSMITATVGDPDTERANKKPLSLLDDGAISTEQRSVLLEAWRRQTSDDYRALAADRTGLEKDLEDLHAAIPRAMVMQELEEPRPTYILMRGQYDLPDESRPVERGAPHFLTPLPEDAPKNRLGLARWLTAPDNALFARVTVNRYWQLLFGTGIVSTSDDFGLQGDWPSHPELLDWLAVEFRESEWNLHALLRKVVLSSTYRQSSVIRPELVERDPQNRWLASYPRRRLDAEQIRDHALAISGLLVERFGGASVRPYQPKGLWQEVAMLSSNTRFFEEGNGEDLWRRSLYTFWKRAVPPPSLATFDAPTRESCVVRRQATNTPLQALVLWNDEQFVEAARVLAERAFTRRSTDRERIVYIFQACTSRTPEPTEIDRVLVALGSFRERFKAAPDDAAALIEVGESPRNREIESAELGSWTMIASTIFNLHETLTQD